MKKRIAGIMLMLIAGIGLLGCGNTNASAIDETCDKVGLDFRNNNGPDKDVLTHKSQTFKNPDIFKYSSIAEVSLIMPEVTSRNEFYGAGNSGVESDVEKSYLEIKPMKLDGYEDWVPNSDLEQYSLDNIANNLEFRDNRQINEVEAFKVDKNSELLKYLYPECTVISINVYVENLKNTEEGAMYAGTGILIGPNTVLTCAHTLYLEYETKNVNGKKYTTRYAGDISDISVGGDLQEMRDGTIVGETIVAHATDVYVNSKYIDAVNELQGTNTDICEADYTRIRFEDDVAVLKLDSNIGDDLGWIGILPFEVTGNRKWATVYGFPTVVPKLPELNVLASYLKADLNRIAEEKYDKMASGVVISLTSAIDALNKDGDEINKKYYTGLMELNGYEMYKSYSMLDYGTIYPKLLAYEMSTYYGDSGAPLIQTVYNSRLNKYFPYTWVFI